MKKLGLWPRCDQSWILNIDFIYSFKICTNNTFKNTKFAQRLRGHKRCWLEYTAIQKWNNFYFLREGYRIQECCYGKSLLCSDEFIKQGQEHLGNNEIMKFSVSRSKYPYKSVANISFSVNSKRPGSTQKLIPELHKWILHKFMSREDNKTSSSQLRTIFPSRGHLAMSGDISVVTTGGKVC